MSVDDQRQHAPRRGAARILATVLGTVMLAQPLAAQSITIAWDPNTESNLAGYRVYIGTESGSYSQSYEVSTDAPTFAYLNPDPGTRYFFAVSAYNEAGLESDLSNEISAVYDAPTVPAAPELVSPSGVAVWTLAPTFIWQAVDAAAGYHLWVDDLTGRGRIHGVYTAAQAGCAGGAGAPCAASPGIVVVGAGRWWVRAFNAAGDGPWSLPSSFIVTPWWRTRVARPHSASPHQ